MAGAFIAGWVVCTAFWFGIAGMIWKLFFNPRLEALKASLADERERCDMQLAVQSARISQLEGALMSAHAPQALRQEVQRALSELDVRLDEHARGETK